VGSLTSELPANWRAQLEAAVNEAESWVSAAISAIDGIWNGRTRRARKREFKKHRAFSFWFGTSIVTIRQIRILRRRIHKMGRFFHQRRLNFTVNQRQHKSKSHGCFTKKNGSFNIALTVAPVIYLCPTFWTQSTATSRVRTIVHELTHRLLQPLALVTIPTGIFTHPWVNGRPVNTDTDVSGAEVLAHNRAMASRRSPVNWAFCFQEIGTRVRPTRATIRNEP
jgi:Lysine-specific metallo-endopeptidase